MLEAFKIFRNKHDELKVKMLLIGNLDERDILPEESRKFISEDKDVIMTGWVDKADIPYYYRLLDCFIFPSHREGFGMCVIEASAMEVPILVAPSHGCIDSIQEGVSGYYIGLDSESIFHGMERMLGKESMAIVGRQGRQFVLENFDCRKMWPMVDELYMEILR